MTPEQHVKLVELADEMAILSANLKDDRERKAVYLSAKLMAKLSLVSSVVETIYISQMLEKINDNVDSLRDSIDAWYNSTGFKHED